VTTPRCMFLVSLFWRWIDLTEWYPPLAILWCSNFGIQVYQQVTYEKWTDMELCQGDNIPSPK
jgi:hypothetical protein